MSFRLNDGTNFRITDKNNKDISSQGKIDPAKANLQIDTDKDGKFDGPNDLTISDELKLKNILDKNSANNENIKEIPFVDEISQHLAKSDEIRPLLDVAEKKGKESRNTSIIYLDKKIELGKIAFDNTKKSYEIDRANPSAKFSYGMALVKIHKETFRKKAEAAMQINLEASIKDVVKELEKDKNDIPTQVVLRELYNETGDPNKARVEKNLAALKNSYPAEYNLATEKVKKILEDKD
jgi:hypothetical protein